MTYVLFIAGLFSWLCAITAKTTTIQGDLIQALNIVISYAIMALAISLHQRGQSKGPRR